ncbi:MAG: hypothetical protein KDB82_01050 [Planctomycetes bacterium]|nr:hypothetical protein [Planctomycetota bacterium]
MPDTDKQDTQRDRKPVPDQVVVRGDANALKEIADALGGKTLQPNVRAFAIPASNEAYSEAIDNGAVAALHAAGFTICNPATSDPELSQGEFGLNYPAVELTEVVESIRAQ